MWLVHVQYFVGSFLNNVIELGETGTPLELSIQCSPINPEEQGVKEEEEEDHGSRYDDDDDDSEDEEEGGFACPCTKAGGRSRMHSSSSMATAYSSCAHKEYSSLRFKIYGPNGKSRMLTMKHVQ